MFSQHDIKEILWGAANELSASGSLSPRFLVSFVNTDEIDSFTFAANLFVENAEDVNEEDLMIAYKDAVAGFKNQIVTEIGQNPLVDSFIFTDKTNIYLTNDSVPTQTILLQLVTRAGIKRAFILKLQDNRVCDDINIIYLHDPLLDSAFELSHTC